MPFTLDQILPWGRSFDEYVAMFALCSHLLFTCSEQLSASFHVEAVPEMRRAAREVRIFPNVEMQGEQSRHVPAVCEALDGHGFRWSIEAVEYEFQRGGNKMLRVRDDKALQ